MTKLGRRAIYGDTCAAPGCNAPRHVLNSKGTPSRSRLCDRHYREDMAARRAEQQAAKPATREYTVADVYELWRTNAAPPTFYYVGKRVYVISSSVKWNGVTGYELLLSGEDEPRWVNGETLLVVKS